jgi:membrane peptidoglycan carboxypeptidase
MVGSKSYSGVSEGCDAAGINCTYDPQVNIITSKQSPGSSTKPMGYYEAYAEGKLFTGSLLPDVPLDVPGYNLKNWNSGVSGVGGGTYAQNMLVQSLNLPAIQVIQLIGVEKFVEVMQNFGYSTFDDLLSMSFCNTRRFDVNL